MKPLNEFKFIHRALQNAHASIRKSMPKGDKGLIRMAGANYFLIVVGDTSDGKHGAELIAAHRFEDQRRVILKTAEAIGIDIMHTAQTLMASTELNDHLEATKESLKKPDIKP